METITGVIEEKNSKDGDRDGQKWKRTVYELLGKKYSTFKLHEYNIGDKVNISYEVNDQYNNIKGIVLMEKSTGVIVEQVEERRVPALYVNEGAEFGLACNLALRKTLTEKDGNFTFEELYKQNVKLMHRWNKELRGELIK